MPLKFNKHHLMCSLRQAETYIIRTIGNWVSQRLLELPPFSLMVWNHEICNLDKILMKNEHFWRRMRE